MASSKFTFELGEDLRGVMDAHPEVNWSAVLRQAVQRHAEAAELAQQILDEEKDPRYQEMVDDLKRRVGERYREAVARRQAE